MRLHHCDNNIYFFNNGNAPISTRNVTSNSCGYIKKGVYNKPGFYSEMGAHEVWDCDNNVENRRSIWQSYFLGISGGLEWHFPADLSIYSRVNSFIEGVNLEGENWHPGAFDRENDGEWKFNDNYHDDCVREDELADVVYLRSGDREKAFGVITNRRANYYTLGEGECNENSADIPAPEHSDFEDDMLEEEVLPDEAWFTHLLRSYGPVTHNMNDFGDLRIRNMSGGFLGLPKEYKIKYYSPYDQTNSIKEETRWSPNLKLEHPDLDTLDIVLFEIFPIGENFKSMQNDTTDLNDTFIREPKNEKEDKVKIYPNPNNGDFIVLIESPENVKSIQIVDNLGKQILTLFEVLQKNKFNSLNLNSGVYFIEIKFETEIIRKKIVIN